MKKHKLGIKIIIALSTISMFGCVSSQGSNDNSIKSSQPQVPAGYLRTYTQPQIPSSYPRTYTQPQVPAESTYPQDDISSEIERGNNVIEKYNRDLKNRNISNYQRGSIQVDQDYLNHSRAKSYAPGN
ncbi:hypothetical protein H6G81_10770 [Scytonema hofmannii FACHB-248]|uniref:Lipoprotein n=1 Tax=Scytonema hofmannii FACHB-248 TaxID=1842502 RepID=A0ABR8GPM4_9CYAN|nr:MULTISPECIES: hypothetical protein [Nostocales]MBD2605000.1 hypothetical protein [Scytonema hofmannii FACHB-248]